MIRQDLLEALHANMRFYACYFANFLPKVHLLEQPDITVVQSDLPDDTFNFAISTFFTAENAAKRIDETVRIFKEKGLPFCWWVSEACDTPSDLKERLTSKGFILKSTEVGMYLELDTYQAPQIDALVRRVVSRPLLKDLIDVFISVEGRSDVYHMLYQDLPLDLIQEGSAFEFYILYVDQVPVATGLLIFHAHVAGIYYIFTRPEYRKKNLATQMMHTLLFRACEKGYAVAVLQASSQGLDLYRKLGFKELCCIYEYTFS